MRHCRLLEVPTVGTCNRDQAIVILEIHQAKRRRFILAHQPAVVHLAVAATVVDVGTEGGDLDGLAPEHHMRQAEAAADQEAVAERALDLVGPGRSAYVEVLWLAPHEKVAHAAAYEVGDIAET